MTVDLAQFRTFALAHMMELEAILSEVYAARCAGRDGFALFDGGAHKAWHTLRMLALPGTARVHAVEADPFMAETFLEIVGRQDPATASRVVFHQMALQDDPDVAEIPWRSSSSHVGRSSIVSGKSERPTIWSGNAEMAYRDETEVAATTIDRLLRDEPLPVPFLKLDLEGADLLALLGAERTLADKRPIVAFENSVHAPKVHGFTLDDMVSYFDRLGYVPMTFVGAPMRPDNWFGFFEAWAAPAEDEAWLRDAVGTAIARRLP